MAINKIWSSASSVVADVADGSSVAIAGFGVGHRFPLTLITALRDHGAKNLCVVCNYLGAPGSQAQVLAENNQVSKLIVSFSSRPRLSTASADQIAAGKIELEMVPQGTLVERLRAGGTGIAAFYTPVAAETLLAEDKEVRHFDGIPHVLEHGLKVDVALIRAHRADPLGNLTFRGGSQNFNPSFAKAARLTIVEAEEIVEVGDLAPESVDLPGIFVDRVVQSEVALDHRRLAHPMKRGGETKRTYDGKPALSREEVAEVAAALVPDGSYINLGTGIPSFVSDALSDRDVMLHAENGILGFGAVVDGTEADPDYFNAGGNFVQVKPGASVFDSVESFEIARSGRLDAIVLGAYQVDSSGAIANWTTPGMIGGGIGGAMDLVSSRTTLIVTMEHLGSKGEPKLVEECTYPITGRDCVDIVVTDLAVLRRVDGSFTLEAVCEGFTPDEVVNLTAMPLVVPPSVRTMQPRAGRGPVA